ncbi:hypothetical protein POVWA2_028760 [Plasmodium ovale wallikeri]|uniref:Uncharacterized protein n=1 Tax=Plasmodium ovale wallikeri TaxID=864142 RepID=A0A1A8YX22_PLAOA|nr:hypothetical protein POVWA1_028920 [Plasmodium ovale wallikeri]SBT36153.1 hypothetical protein POVWA2_028760 [Plasmodium ovale wallikeri]
MYIRAKVEGILFLLITICTLLRKNSNIKSHYKILSISCINSELRKHTLLISFKILSSKICNQRSPRPAADSARNVGKTVSHKKWHDHRQQKKQRQQKWRRVHGNIYILMC